MVERMRRLRLKDDHHLANILNLTKWGLYDRVQWVETLRKNWNVVSFNKDPCGHSIQDFTSSWSSFLPSSLNGNKIIMEHVPSITAQTFVIGQQSNSMIKKQNKKRKYKVIYFSYTFYVLFHLKLKMFLWLCVKVVNSFKLLGQFLELHKTQFLKD